MDELAPDHSTFSRFRSRLSKKTMNAINHELLSQFASRGLDIHEGIAIDARLVQSASHPLSEDKLKEERSKQETPEGNLDNPASTVIGKFWRLFQCKLLKSRVAMLRKAQKA